MVQSTKNTQMCFGRKKRTRQSSSLAKHTMARSPNGVFRRKCRQTTKRRKKGNNNEMVSGVASVAGCYIQF